MEHKFKYFWKIHLSTSAIFFFLFLLTRLFILADFNKLVFEVIGTQENRYLTSIVFFSTHFFIGVFVLAYSIGKYEESKEQSKNFTL